MRPILSRSLLTVAAASSILAVTGGYAHADSDAQGATSHSPGVLSGNSLEVPIDVPVNACGNTANVVGADNAAFGNRCTNASHGHAHHHSAGPAAEHSAEHSGGQSSGRPSGHAPAHSSAGSSAASDTSDSAGVAAGNAVKIPLDLPANVCGNTVDPVALLNAAFGNSCDSGEVPGPSAETPPGPQDHSVHLAPPADVRNVPPAQAAVHHADPVDQQVLAETGAGGGRLGTAGASGAALLLGGAMLYRRGRGPRAAHAVSAASADRIRRTYS